MSVEKYKPHFTPHLLQTKIAKSQGRTDDAATSARKTVQSVKDTIKRTRELIDQSKQLVDGVRKRR